MSTRTQDRALGGYRLTGGFHQRATSHTNVAGGDWHVARTDDGAHRIGRGRGYFKTTLFSGSRSECADVAMRLNAGEDIKAVLRDFGVDDDDE